MTDDVSASAIPDVKKSDATDVIGPIANRWSPRAFLDKPVDKATIHALLDAARWAASSNNEQPWRYMVATKENAAEFAKLVSILVPKNQLWASKAPVLMLSIAKKTFTYHGKPNRHYLHDTGAATQLLGIQAAAMGLQIHSMGGFDMEKSRATFNIPNDFEPAAAIAIGYPGPPENAAEEFRAGETSPRTRKALGEMAFEGTFGTAFKG